ncbi:MAG TPA: lysophospholipid acyltransferase family protein [Syntrophales bacterium]|nr:lysophospholipid acyltransferase family protein [Syntrophales bacterium]
MAALKDIKFFVAKNCLITLGYCVCRLHASTIRVIPEGVARVQDHIANGGTVIFACWHQRFFSGFWVPKIFGMNPCIMISQSRDGDVVSDVVARIGWVPVRGSTSRGGKKALQEMITGVEKYRMGAHIVDGPQGPPQIIKPGLVALASQTGAAISPGYISYENPWVFKSWDRFMIPKPFSRVLLRAGEFITVPKDLDEKTFEDIRLDVERTMIEGYAKADASWKQQ